MTREEAEYLGALKQDIWMLREFANQAIDLLKLDRKNLIPAMKVAMGYTSDDDCAAPTP